jgi:hypothetical protein
MLPYPHSLSNCISIPHGNSNNVPNTHTDIHSIGDSDVVTVKHTLVHANRNSFAHTNHIAIAYSHMHTDIYSIDQPYQHSIMHTNLVTDHKSNSVSNCDTHTYAFPHTHNYTVCVPDYVSNLHADGLTLTHSIGDSIDIPNGNTYNVADIYAITHFYHNTNVIAVM